MKKVLVVNDKKSISDIVKFDLAKEGYDVYTAYGGGEALEKAAEAEPDLILSDLMLPRMDGLEVAREVRKIYDMSIIMVTTKDSEIDKVLGLELSIDDYVIKPFPNRELIARVKASLRHGATATKEPEEAAPAELTIGDSTIHPEVYMVTKRGEIIELIYRESELLLYLAKYLEQVVIREHLLQTVWGYDYSGDVRTVNITVCRLREEIEDNPNHPNYLATCCGIGYHLYNPEQE